MAHLISLASLVQAKVDQLEYLLEQEKAINIKLMKKLIATKKPFGKPKNKLTVGM